MEHNDTIDLSNNNKKNNQFNLWIYNLLSETTIDDTNWIDLLNENIFSWRVLDLWGWNGKHAKILQKKWATIDIVDSNISQSLLQNSWCDQNIFLHNTSIQNFIAHLDKYYNIVILSYVIHFFSKDFFNTIIEKISHHLTPWWILYIAYFHNDDLIFSESNKTPTQYWNNFSIDGYTKIHETDDYITDFHPPYWIHKHHVWRIIFEKL